MRATDGIDSEARSWFVRLNDAEATEADWLEFLAWVEADEAHGPAYERLEQLWVGLDGAMAIKPARGASPINQRQSSWHFPVAAIAATLVLVVVLGTLFLRDQARVYRSDNEIRQLTLEDGSLIILNRHSTLSVRQSSGRRDVALLDGEAAFDVRHDASRPFLVSADGRDIRVLGTAFNVLSHEGRFSVSVESGVVAVTPRGEGTVRLTSGRRIVQVGQSHSVVSAIDPAQSSAWREGVLVYRNANLAEIADDLSRYLDKPVEISTSAQTLRYTGVIVLGREETMLRQLEDLLPVVAVGAPERVVLSGREAD